MSNDARIYYNRDDLVLVRETDPQDFFQWLIDSMGGLENIPQSLRDKITTAEVLLARLLDAMIDGDTLWLCKSNFMEPLWGHEGIALVRDGKPIIYKLVWNH